jgi:hypothetical protein
MPGHNGFVWQKEVSMKKSIYIVLLVISIIILLSGLTMSYFHDKSDKIQIPFTTGTFKVKITESPINQEGWKPGVDNAIPLVWSFKNVGSQPAKIRVKLEGEWNGNYGTLNDQAVGWDIMDKYDLDWEDGVYYVYDGPVDKNEKVSIGFNVWLEINDIENCEVYNEADYNITLTLEAIQETGSWE